MARSLLQSFVNGTRQMLAVQLFFSVSTVALAGYTAMVTNRAIAERNREHERVIQLEQALGEADIVPPEATTLPTQQPENLYPPSSEGATTAPVEQTPDTTTQIETTTAAPPPVQTTPTQDRSTTAPPPPTNVDTKPPTTTTAQPEAPLSPVQILRDLLTPPPPLHTLVLHVRAQSDVDEAQRVARALAANANLAVSIDVMPAGDTRESGYAYFHGRQAGPAATLVQRLQDAARSAEIAPWVAQLRGTALPASGEYTADRLDVVLPPLPAPPSTGPNIRQQINRNAIRNYQIQQQAQQPVIR